jgi:hypothetical protein
MRSVSPPLRQANSCCPGSVYFSFETAVRSDHSDTRKCGGGFTVYFSFETAVRSDRAKKGVVLRRGRTT